MITAFALGVVINQRQMHYLPLVGMVFLAAGIAVFRVQVPPTQALDPDRLRAHRNRPRRVGRPGAVRRRFLAASASLQRVFAIVELLRAVAAFMIAPVFAHFAATVGGNLEPEPRSRCGSASGSRSAARRSGSASTCSAARGRRRRPRALPRRRGTRLVLAAAAGGGPQPPRHAGSPRSPLGHDRGQPTTRRAARRIRLRRLRAGQAGDRGGRAAAGTGTRRARPHRLAAIQCRVRARGAGFDFDAAQISEVKRRGRANRRRGSLAGRSSGIPRTAPLPRRRRPGRGSSRPPTSTTRA